MARKRRFEQLQAAAAAPQDKRIYTNPLQKQASERLDEIGAKLEGKGKTILYGVAAFIVLVILITLFFNYSRSASGKAQTALGKAIETSKAAISETGTPVGSTAKTYKTEKERAEAAIIEFQAVIDNFGGDVGEKAKYFIAVSKLDVDRPTAITELEGLATANSDVGKLAKFALAQTRFSDNKLDEAVALYQELEKMDNPVIAKDTLNFEIAKIYEKQDKKTEAVDIYFNIAKIASEAKDLDGKPIAQSQTAIEAKKKLTDLDPERAKQIVDPTPDLPSGSTSTVPVNVP